MKKAILSALLAGAAVFSAAPSEARPIDHPHATFHARVGVHPRAAIRPHARFVFRHDFRHFTPAEHRWWRGGRWHHMWWHGRYGWWWGVGGAFYWYPAPVYPYPYEVSPTYYDDDYDGGYDDEAGPDDQGGYDDQGGGYDDQAGPGDQGGGYGTWYHCRSPEGYYPYVKTCKGGWEEEPAQPNDMQGGPGGPGDQDQGPPPGYDDQAPPPPR
ncbi:MAG TPA: hypothetical protein VG889_08905 [Rhizomicrobium sp.]|nr:hypothetical protein [Rhizomicrobium sp.]